VIEETCPTDVDFGKQKQKGKGPATSFILTNMVKAVFGLAWGGEKEMADGTNVYVRVIPGYGVQHIPLYLVPGNIARMQAWRGTSSGLAGGCACCGHHGRFK